MSVSVANQNHVGICIYNEFTFVYVTNKQVGGFTRYKKAGFFLLIKAIAIDVYDVFLCCIVVLLSQVRERVSSAYKHVSQRKVLCYSFVLLLKAAL